jgi:hypothetical protein
MGELHNPFTLYANGFWLGVGIFIAWELMTDLGELIRRASERRRNRKEANR